MLTALHASRAARRLPLIPRGVGCGRAYAAEDVAQRLFDRSSIISSFNMPVGSDALEITWNDGHVSHFHYVWLRDHCPSLFDAETRQRTVPHPNIPLDIVPKRVAINDSNADEDRVGRAQSAESGTVLTIEWPASTTTSEKLLAPVSHFQAHWLRQACYSPPQRNTRSHVRKAIRTPWTGGGAGGGTFMPASHNFEEVMGSSHGMWSAMSSLWRDGLVLVHGVPKCYDSNTASINNDGGGDSGVSSNSNTMYMDATEALAKRVGFVRRTIYGKMWAFGTYDGSDQANDSAYSNIALEMHTDGTYMRDPPALQLWTCMFEAKGGGGVSRYLDGLKVAERLQEIDPEAYEFFRTTPLSYHCQDEGANLVGVGPVFEHSALDSTMIDRFRYNDYDRLTISHLPAEKVSRFYKHHRTLASIITDQSMELHIKLTPGTMIIVHNHRVMHGRSAFKGQRGLCGCYIGDDEFRSTLRCLTKELGNKTEQGQSTQDNAWNLLLTEGLDLGIMPPSSLCS